jgi:chemotaxis protein CheX
MTSQEGHRARSGCGYRVVVQVDPDQTTTVALNGESLMDLVAECWTVYFGRPDGEAPTRIDDPGPLDVVASISLTGAWDGHVIVSMTEAAAMMITAAMLDLDAATVADADINDATGEWVNVVGGNVKSLLPQPCQLSLPMTSRSGSRIRYPGTRVLCSLALALRGEPVTVSVRQLDLS